MPPFQPQGYMPTVPQQFYPQMQPQMMPPQMPQVPQAPVTTSGSSTSVEISGAIVQFANGSARIGDIKLEALPAGINWSVANSVNGEYLRTLTVWKGTAHVGAHGRAWVDNLVNTGAPAPAGRNEADQAAAFSRMLAQAKGQTVAKSDETAM